MSTRTVLPTREGEAAAAQGCYPAFCPSETHFQQPGLLADTIAVGLRERRPGREPHLARSLVNAKLLGIPGSLFDEGHVSAGRLAL